MLNDIQIRILNRELKNDPRGYGWSQMLLGDNIEDIVTLINRNPIKGSTEDVMTVAEALKKIPAKELLKIRNDKTFWAKKARQGQTFYDVMVLMGNAGHAVDLTDTHFKENVKYCLKNKLISKQTAISLTYNEDMPKRKKNKDRCRSRDLGIFPVEGPDILMIIGGDKK